MRLPWDERIDAPDLAWARIGVGVAALAEGLYVASLFDRAIRPAMLRIPVTDWSPAPTPMLVLVLGGVWLVAAVAFAVGFRTRASGTVLAATMAFTMTLDLQFYSNHLYLVALLVVLLTAANAGGYRSVDAGEDRAPDASPVWGVFLLRAQVSIVYLFAALSKVNLAYASGAVLALNLRRTGPLSIPEAWRSPGLFASIAVASILVELYLAAALWSPRWHRAAMVIGVAYHGALVALVADRLPFAVFGLALVSAYAAFYVPLPMPARRLEWEEAGV